MNRLLAFLQRRPGLPRSQERLAVGLFVAALAGLRSATLVFYEGARFDSDQAVLGLMAKHLIEGRALPIFTYGQPYMLGVEAWMAAPFFLVGGVTVAMLKLPLLIINVIVSVLLVGLVERTTGLRPVLALVPALFFVLAPPGTATLLLEASGGNVEPFLIVLLLWALRARPVAFGVVLAFGVLQREFAVYALGAFAILRIADGSLLRRASWTPVLVGALAFAAMWQGVYLLKQFSSIAGPGTSAAWAPLEASANLVALAARVCIDPAEILPGLRGLLTTHLADLVGASDHAMVAYTVNSLRRQGAPWLWPVLGPALALALGRIAWLAARGRTRPWQAPLEFATYLSLVGLQAVLVYAVMRCGLLGIAEMRYSLLGLFGAVGIVAAFLRLEPRRLLRATGIGVVLLWAGVAIAAHARLAHQYAFDPPPNPRRALANTLLERGVRFAYADFWEAYIVVFYTNEQVIVAPTAFRFIHEYQWIVDRRSDEAVLISRQPCSDGTRVADWLYICPMP